MFSLLTTKLYCTRDDWHIFCNLYIFLYLTFFCTMKRGEWVRVNTFIKPPYFQQLTTLGMMEWKEEKVMRWESEGLGGRGEEGVKEERKTRLECKAENS